MRIYWTLRQIPELASLSSTERSASWRRIYPKTFRHWQTWAGLINCAGLSGVGSYVGRSVGFSFIGTLVGGGIGGLVFSQTAFYVARRYYKSDFLGKR
ncbi:hypothetical protein DXT88_20360 [Herbaspirillum lusitanum]|nr:hypothetical protein [Herbaspirillum lusitanum]